MFLQMNDKHQSILFGNSGKVVEWTGETYAEGRNFNFTDHVVCDMREAKLIRLELKGTD